MTRTAWMAPLLLAAACVGDTPSSNLGTDAGVAEAGAPDGSTTPIVGGDSQKPSIELLVEPVEVIRGRQGTVHVNVARRSGGPIDYALELQGTPPEFSLGSPVMLTTSMDAVDLKFDCAPSAEFGPRTVRVVAKGPGADTVTVDVSIKVRGEVGAIDETFGFGGSVEGPVNVSLTDSVLLADGRILALGADGRIVRYDAGGKLDSSFGLDGEVHIDNPHGGESTLRPFRLEPRGGGWEVTTVSADPLSFFHAVVPTDAPFGVVNDPAAPTIQPSDSLTFRPNDVVVANGSGFLWGRSSASEYSRFGKIEHRDQNGAPVDEWGDAGAVSTAFLETTGTEYSVLDIQISSTMIFAVVERQLTSLPNSNTRAILLINRSTGARLAPTYLPNGARNVSSASANNEVLSVVPGRRACVVRVESNGAKDEWPTDCSLGTNVTDDDARAIFLRDGRALEVTLGVAPKLFTLLSDGRAESPLDGTPLQFGDAADVSMVRLFEDDARRLIVVARGTLGPRWIIKRFWL